MPSVFCLGRWEQNVNALCFCSGRWGQNVNALFCSGLWEQHVNAIRGASALLSLLRHAEKSRDNFGWSIRGRPYQDLSALSLSGLATSILPLHWSSDGKLDTVLLPSRCRRVACGDKRGEPTHTGTRMPAPRTPSGRSSSTRAGDRVQLAHALPAPDICFPPMTDIM